MEKRPYNGFTFLNVETTSNTFFLRVSGGERSKTIRIYSPSGEEVVEERFAGSQYQIQIDDPIVWTPENPQLYTFELSDEKDVVRSYFALRSFVIRSRGSGGQFYLNGKQIFLHGVLDQGYFHDGISTPSSPKRYSQDISAMKKLGFNTIRKHIKVEPEVFYYECDKQGILVIQDIPNSGTPNLTLPDIFPVQGDAIKLSSLTSEPVVPLSQSNQFIKDAREVTNLLQSHPSVVIFTIFNEGWGQHDSNSLYKTLKNAHPLRFFDTASGWYEPASTDVVSRHVYNAPNFSFLRSHIRSDRPLIISETGGFTLNIPGHLFNASSTYGHHICTSNDTLQDDIDNLYLSQILPLVRGGGVGGVIYTQLSDVEEETNGLLTYDREVLKVNATRMQSIASQLELALT